MTLSEYIRRFTTSDEPQEHAPKRKCCPFCGRRTRASTCEHCRDLERLDRAEAR